MLLSGFPSHFIGIECITIDMYIVLGFPGGLNVKNPPANAGDIGSIPRSGKSPGEGNGNPLQQPGKPGQRSLMGYSPWSHKRIGHNLVT